jgi:hypothetical protein
MKKNLSELIQAYNQTFKEEERIRAETAKQIKELREKRERIYKEWKAAGGKIE